METEIILHRGYKGKYLENSKIAFENAIKEGMSFETDIRTSKDKKCFLIHDEHLGRLFGISGRIQDYNSEKLKDIRYLGNSAHLVLLDELIDLIKRNKENLNKIFVHIKQLDDIYNVMGSLTSNLSDKLRFFSCDDITMDLVDIIKKNYPKYKVGLYVTENSHYKKIEYFKKADFIWADEIKKKGITLGLVNLAYDSGNPIYVMSPELIPESVFNQNIIARWKEFIKMNVDGICTDKPIELLKFLKGH